MRLISCDVFTAELPEMEWLVEGLFEKDSIVSLFSPPGAGKSFLALSWAMSIASGRPWLGRPVSQGAVIYIASEGPRGMRRRAAGWMRYHNVASVPDMYFLPDSVG